MTVSSRRRSDGERTVCRYSFVKPVGASGAFFDSPFRSRMSCRTKPESPRCALSTENPYHSGAFSTGKKNPSDSESEIRSIAFSGNVRVEHHFSTQYSYGNWRYGEQPLPSWLDSELSPGCVYSSPEPSSRNTVVFDHRPDRPRVISLRRSRLRNAFDTPGGEMGDRQPAKALAHTWAESATS